jgi:hypothetical protein
MYSFRRIIGIRQNYVVLCTQVIFNFPADSAYMGGSSRTTVALYRGIHLKRWINKVFPVISDGGTAAVINNQSAGVSIVSLRYGA